MTRLCGSVTLGLALMATVAWGANRQLSTPTPLGSATVLGQDGSLELPMPAPLNGTAVPLSPTPEIQYSGPVGQLPVIPAGNVELYQNVKYRSPRNMAPCSMPIIVQVPDPCAPRNSCCPRPCVNVEICVPTCGCPNVCVTRCGNRTRYDYGKYEITITSIAGRVVVDYDD